MTDFEYVTQTNKLSDHIKYYLLPAEIYHELDDTSEWDTPVEECTTLVRIDYQEKIAEYTTYPDELSWDGWQNYNAEPDDFGAVVELINKKASKYFFCACIFYLTD